MFLNFRSLGFDRMRCAGAAELGYGFNDRPGNEAIAVPGDVI
jgi:hypothetical protein